MLTKKQIVQTTGMVAATLVISLTLPTGQSHAAALPDKIGSTSSWVNSIFQKVWEKANSGKKDDDKSEDSTDTDNNDNEQKPLPDNEKPGNEKPDVEEKPGNEKPDVEEKPDTGNEEQSNVVLADKIIKTGEKYLGTPYKLGAASGQTSTFDCSSFTQYIFKQHDISLPRSSKQQSTVGTTVPRNQLKKGDLLFFKISSSNGSVGHVAIYAGDNKILHTWGPGGVRYDSLSTKWLDQGYLHAKRVIK